MTGLFILAIAALAVTLGAGTAAAAAAVSPELRKRWRRVAIVAARKLVIYYRSGHRGPRVIARFQQILRVPATGTVDARTEARVFELLGPVIWSDEKSLADKTDPVKQAEKRERERKERERKPKPEPKAKGPTAATRQPITARGPSAATPTATSRQPAAVPIVYQATRYGVPEARPAPAGVSPEEAARVLRAYTVDGGNQGTKANPSAVVRRSQELMQGIAVDGIVGPETRTRAKQLGYVLALRDQQRPGVDNGKYLSLLN